MHSFEFTPQFRDLIHQRLDGFDAQKIDPAGLRDAAVAIVIANDAATGHPGVLLTLRPRKLNRHAGQYALPGGRLEDGETDIQAARRELCEELGLDLNPEDVLGQLDHFPTRSGFRVSPIVMWAEGDIQLRPDPSEVAAVFYVPLTELNSPDIPRLQNSANSDHPVLSAFFPALGHHIYAPTAAILYQFREIALRGVATRAAHFDQPEFAWK